MMRFRHILALNATAFLLFFGTLAFSGMQAEMNWTVDPDAHNHVIPQQWGAP